MAVVKPGSESRSPVAREGGMTWVIAKAFANSCEAQAELRLHRAEEDGDERNLHAVHALRTAATWALTADGAEQTLMEAMPLAVIDMETGLLLLNEKASEIFSTFCFDRSETIHGWLARVADAHYRELFEEEPYVDQVRGSQSDSG